jgi:hypothetical protein
MKSPEAAIAPCRDIVARSAHPTPSLTGHWNQGNLSKWAESPWISH